MHLSPTIFFVSVTSCEQRRLTDHNHWVMLRQNYLTTHSFVCHGFSVESILPRQLCSWPLNSMSCAKPHEGSLAFRATIHLHPLASCRHGVTFWKSSTRKFVSNNVGPNAVPRFVFPSLGLDSRPANRTWWVWKKSISCAFPNTGVEELIGERWDLRLGFLSLDLRLCWHCWNLRRDDIAASARSMWTHKSKVHLLRKSNKIKHLFFIIKSIKQKQTLWVDRRVFIFVGLLQWHKWKQYFSSSVY